MVYVEIIFFLKSDDTSFLCIKQVRAPVIIELFQSLNLPVDKGRPIFYGMPVGIIDSHFVQYGKSFHLTNHLAC